MSLVIQTMVTLSWSLFWGENSHQEKHPAPQDRLASRVCSAPPACAKYANLLFTAVDIVGLLSKTAASCRYLREITTCYLFAQSRDPGTLYTHAPPPALVVPFASRYYVCAEVQRLARSTLLHRLYPACRFVRKRGHKAQLPHTCKRKGCRVKRQSISAPCHRATFAAGRERETDGPRCFCDAC